MSGRLRKDDALSAAARIIEAESESSSAFFHQRWLSVLSSQRWRSMASAQRIDLQRALERISDSDAGLRQVFR